MESGDRKLAILLEAPDATRAQLAKGLLDAAGIPHLEHGMDRDLAELGQAAHDVISRPDLMVPMEALERAREVLRAAWGDDPELAARG